MPNGGSDCCGTCWFNTVNGGEPGFPEKENISKISCEIRGFTPDIPFWTYCANHPHHNPSKIRVPIGPVYVCEEDSYSRIEKTKPEDNEDVRNKLIQLVEGIPKIPRSEYPSQTKFDIEVLRHIGFIKEQRAEHAVVRILDFDPLAEPAEKKFGQNNVLIISNALETLALISPETALNHIRPWVMAGRETLVADDYDQENDKLAPIRYHAVRSLKNVEGDISSDIELAINDPHPEIRAFANEISRIKNT